MMRDFTGLNPSFVKEAADSLGQELRRVMANTAHDNETHLSNRAVGLRQRVHLLYPELGPGHPGSARLVWRLSYPDVIKIPNKDRDGHH